MTSIWKVKNTLSYFEISGLNDIGISSTSQNLSISKSAITFLFRPGTILKYTWAKANTPGLYNPSFKAGVN